MRFYQYSDFPIRPGKRDSVTTLVVIMTIIMMTITVTVVTSIVVMAFALPVPMFFPPWAAIVFFDINMSRIRTAGVQGNRYAIRHVSSILRGQGDAYLPVASVQPEPCTRRRRVIHLARRIVDIAVFPLGVFGLGAIAMRGSP